MNIRDFMDLNKLQQIQDSFSNATGLAAISVDDKGEYITEGSNFTEFCMKYTRGSELGGKRCKNVIQTIPVHISATQVLWIFLLTL